MEPENATFLEIFWDSIDKFASITGIISSVISVITLRVARSTKRAIKDHDEIKEYRDEIEDHITNLQGYHSTLKNKDVYTTVLLESILQELDDIKIHYEAVVKVFIKDIDKLDKLIEDTIPKLEQDPLYNSKQIMRLLNIVIQHLIKEKKGL